MRRAFTAMEVLVVIALVALVMAALMPGIQSARRAARRTAAQNVLRQLSVGGQHFVTTKGKIPHTEDSRGGGDVLPMLARYADGNLRSLTDIAKVEERYFLNPADPSPYGGAGNGTCGFAVNSLATQKSIIRDDLPDGLASTIYLVERYATCAKGATYWSLQRSKCIFGDKRVPCDPNSGMRRPSFADAAYTDVRPSRGESGKWSLPDKVFQVSPSADKCDANLPQATDPGGLLTAFADGSVHTIRPSVAPAVFWGLVTPDGGEAPGDW